MLQSVTPSGFSKIFRRIRGISCGILVFLTVSEHLFEIVYTVGPSMLPAIAPGELYLCRVCGGKKCFVPGVQANSKCAAGLGSTLQRPLAIGDVIACRSPTEPSVSICKRVAALDGDILVHDDCWTTYDHVPVGHMWLTGDNLATSLDSRTFGPVPRGLIRSRFLFCIWPPYKWGYIPSRADCTRK